MDRQRDLYAIVWDEEGREYIDARGGLWYCAAGHGRAEIADAAAAQMRTLAAYDTLGCGSQAVVNKAKAKRKTGTSFLIACLRRRMTLGPIWRRQVAAQVFRFVARKWGQG